MALTRALEDRIAAFDNQIKSDQIALLATAPLIRSTAAPSTGLQLPNMPITSASDVFCRFPTWTTLPMLMYEYVSEPALHRSCCRSSKQDGSASLGMWHGWVTRVTCPGLYIPLVSIRTLPKDWRRRPGRPRHTWLWTLEADLQPLNHGLNSAWRHAQDRGRWKQLVETATLQSGARP